MSVGVPALDSDHRCLVRIINLLGEAGEAAHGSEIVHTVLDTLQLYGRYHFAREEKVMSACGFPGASFHHGEHAGFVRYVRTVRERADRESTPEMAQELLDYLRQWLLHHILIQDMAFKPYVANVGSAEKAARSSGPGLEELRLQAVTPDR